jgi:hypothetical protein
MKMDKKKGIVGREEEMDRFWDIDSLVPKKKVGYSGPVDTSTTEIEIPASNTSAEEPQKHPIPAADSTVRRFIPPVIFIYVKSLNCRRSVEKLAHFFFCSHLRN